MKIDNLKVKDIVDEEFFSVSTEDNLKEVLNKIREKNAFAVPVMKDGELEGMITWRKIIQRSAPPKTKVKKLISHPPKIDSNITVVELAEKMLETGSRAVPVYDNNEFLGVVTQSEVIGAVSKDNSFSGKKAGAISTELKTIREDESIGKAKAMMRENRIARLPVVDKDDDLVGSVDLSGIVKTFHPERAMKLGEKKGDSLPERDSPVTSIMNKSPVTVPYNSNIQEVAKEISRGDGLYAITMEENKPQGIVTPKDIVELIASRKKKEGAYIQVAGVQDVDSFMKDKILDSAERKVQKAGRMFKEVQRLILHVKTQNVEGNQRQYSTRARLYTSNGLFTATQDWEWDLLDSVQGCLEKIDKQMTKKHDKQIDRNRG
ncbi:MAG: CBS domain-containing protein [Candidatus Aenigmatarchaeota archaeon]